MNREALIAEAVDSGLNSLDMCGDVDSAIREVAADHSTRFTMDELFRIKKEIHKEWNSYRRNAGVSANKRSGFSESLIYGLPYPDADSETI